MIKHASHPFYDNWTLCSVMTGSAVKIAEAGELIQCSMCIAIQRHCMKFSSSHDRIWLPLKNAPKHINRNLVKK